MTFPNRPSDHRLSRRAFTAGLAALGASPALAGGMGHLRLAEAARGLAPDGLRVLAPTGSEANLDVIAALFSKASGTAITIDLRGIRDVGGELMLQHMSGNGPWDVALPATIELPDLIASGAIAPIPVQALRDPDDGAIYGHGDIFDGRRYGYQTDGDQQILFFNRAILDDPAISKSWEDRTGRPMTVPKSWAELDAQMMHVADPQEDRWGGLLQRTPGFVEVEFWLRLLAKGVWPLDRDLAPQIAGEAGIETLADMIAVQPALAPPATGSLAHVGNTRTFEAGRVLCFLSYGGVQKILNRPGGPLAGRLAFSVPPGGGRDDLPAAIPAMTWGWSYTLPTLSRYAEAAALFSAFAVSTLPSTEAIRVPTGFFDPFLKRHYEDAEIRAVYGSEFLAVHRDAMMNSVPDFYVTGRGDYMASLARWLGLALDGRVTPALALESAANEWALITSTQDRDMQRSRWRALRAAFPAAVASRLTDPGARQSAPVQPNEG